MSVYKLASDSDSRNSNNSYKIRQNISIFMFQQFTTSFEDSNKRLSQNFQQTDSSLEEIITQNQL